MPTSPHGEPARNPPFLFSAPDGTNNAVDAVARISVDPSDLLSSSDVYRRGRQFRELLICLFLLLERGLKKFLTFFIT
jgi:hypothetical protein